MRRKIIVLIISIIIPMIAAVVVGLYDYKIWYSQEGSNASTYRSSYQSYVSGAVLNITGKEEDQIRQTKDRIALYRTIHSYYYSKEPIYIKDVYSNDKLLFTIAIYEDLTLYQPSGTVDPTDRLRYEVYIFNVNYDELKSLFMDPTVRPDNKKDVEDAANPSLIINFYPDTEYKEENALFVAYNNPGHEITLYNGKKVIGSRLTTSSSLALYDYASTPKYNTDDVPYSAQFLGFNDHMSKLNLNDTGDASVDNAKDRFANGAYLKIETILSIDSSNYVYKKNLLTDKVDSLDFDLDKAKPDNYEKGFEDNIINLKLKGVKSYNMWIFAKYVWWQCLIALGAVGLIMTGFYFTFTYEEPKTKKNLKKKK